MSLENKIAELKKTYNIVSEINLDTWHDLPVFKRKLWLKTQLLSVHQTEYQPNDRILFTLTRGDIYNTDNTPAGQILITLITLANEVDISNFFILLLTNDNQFIPDACKWVMTNISKDAVPFTHYAFNDSINKKTLIEKSTKSTTQEKIKQGYNTLAPINIKLESLSTQHQYLLTESNTFCMYPWIHLHTYPTGEAYPCCHAEWKYPAVGNCRDNTLEEIWNSPLQQKLRVDMLSDVPANACNRCYEQEAAGFFSGRQSANKHHGHHIARVDETQPDGTLERFEMTYWDIRFSNLCNLRCRTCGPTFSSQWHADQTALVGPEWGKQNKVLNYSGRTKTDMWEQLIPHLDYVEKIYFAGGEPLIMDEHYNILDELERRGRFDVKLIYNTNFTETKLKNRVVFDYWKKFDSVAVGASLDAMGPRAEYIRKGTNWDQVERNREQMMEICPKVDFYISPTLSIMNALHLPEFHKTWVGKGYINPQDLNVNILQDGPQYRLDIATPKYKEKINDVYRAHLDWLRPLDPLNRATVGFESAINFMMSTDNTALLPKFWETITKLDTIRNENIFDIIPELKDLT